MEGPARLEGSLRLVSLSGLVQLLSSERRSGRLDVEEGGRQGSLWLEAGALVHATAGGESGAVALATLVGLDQGSFRFVPDEPAPGASLSGSTDQLLVEAACRRDDDRRALEGDLPPGAVPGFAPVPAGGATPRFSTLQWRLLALVDGRRDVAGIARESGLPLRAASSLVGELVEAGVLRLT